MNKIKLLTQVLEDTEMNPTARAYMMYLVDSFNEESSPGETKRKLGSSVRDMTHEELIKEMTDPLQILRDLTNLEFEMHNLHYSTSQVQALVRRAKDALGDI